jgi:hypothetical protein
MNLEQSLKSEEDPCTSAAAKKRPRKGRERERNGNSQCHRNEINRISQDPSLS